MSRPKETLVSTKYGYCCTEKKYVLTLHVDNTCSHFMRMFYMHSQILYIRQNSQQNVLSTRNKVKYRSSLLLKSHGQKTETGRLTLGNSRNRSRP